MVSKKQIGIIILGVINFIASIASLLSLIYLIIQDIINDNRSNDHLPIIGIIILLIFVTLYVKMTNFGIVKESELQKNINEKKKLKEQIEIAELKKKLNEINQ